MDIACGARPTITMPFPQIIEDDFYELTAALDELLATSGATSAMIVEKAGYLIIDRGEKPPFDSAVLASLAANAFNATEFMAENMGEHEFSSMYQQGQISNVLWVNVDEDTMFVVVFPTGEDAGMVKTYALTTAGKIAACIERAKRRPDFVSLEDAHGPLSSFVQLAMLSAAGIVTPDGHFLIEHNTRANLASFNWPQLAQPIWQKLRSDQEAPYPSGTAELDADTRALWMALKSVDAMILGVYPASVDPQRVHYYAVELVDQIEERLKKGRKGTA